MSKKSVFVCSSCGGEHVKWSGRCSYCGKWNTLVEMKVDQQMKSEAVEEANVVKLSDIKLSKTMRFKTGIEEFDLVLGGGIVPGSAILLGGQPGIGKSTLVWQAAVNFSGCVVYIAGEESPQQIKMRAQRLSGKFDNILIIDNQDIRSWLNQLKDIKPDLLIIDSIQTIIDSSQTGSPGSIIQIKQTALSIIRKIKELQIATIFIGHVTKDGEVAGPKTLEHIVDAVFYLEGTRGLQERFLRSQKNRFGPTDEMGVFRLTEKGLVSSADFGRLAPEEKLPFGVARTAVVEGSRVYFIEVQALIQKSQFGFAKRNSVGFDLNRLQMIIAILGKSAKIDLLSSDVFINIADGYKLKDPVGDMAVSVAIASAFYNLPAKGIDLFVGEVDLAGRIHLPELAKKIIKTAQKIGYRIPQIETSALKKYFSK